jgi:lambda repressor-like predicted transcriptional regulator
MAVRLRVKEIARAKGFSMGKLQRDADVAYNTVKRIFKDPYYVTTTETLGKLAKALQREAKRLSHYSCSFVGR